MFRRALSIALGLLIAGSATASVTWLVDAANSGDPLEDGSAAHPFDLIQEAIAASSDGDLVLVLPGTYFENIDFLDRDIRVESRDGPIVTMIDGGGIWSVVSIVGGQTRASTLRGFSITNGLGGGTGTYDLGGGVRIYGSEPTIADNRIFHNVAHFGGAIDCDESNPLIIGNEIYENTVSDNHLRHLSGDGGGISVFNSSAEIYNNHIHHNLARRRGGGIITQDAEVLTHTMNVVIANNLVHANTVLDQDGGGLSIRDRGMIVIRGNTIVGNEAAIGGGLLLGGSALEVDFANSILWNNLAGVASEGLVEAFTVVDFSYSIVRGGAGGLAISSQAVVTLGNGILPGPPAFLDEELADFGVDTCSPAVNAGDPDFVARPGETDFSGAVRVIAGRVDIGAYEAAITDANGNDIADECECVGDLNGDGVVSLQDLATLLANFGVPAGASAADGDLDGDADVDIQDLALLLSVFGRGC